MLCCCCFLLLLLLLLLSSDEARYWPMLSLFSVCCWFDVLLYGRFYCVSSDLAICIFGIFIFIVIISGDECDGSYGWSIFSHSCSYSCIYRFILMFVFMALWTPHRSNHLLGREVEMNNTLFYILFNFAFVPLNFTWFIAEIITLQFSISLLSLLCFKLCSVCLQLFVQQAKQLISFCHFFYTFFSLLIYSCTMFVHCW